MLQSRAEEYYAYLIGESSTYPEHPQSRIEEYLHYLCEHGGGGGGGGVDPAQVKALIRQFLEDNPNLIIDATARQWIIRLLYVEETDPIIIPTMDDIPFVTPEQFGAVGDGETDDTEALQDCFNHAMEANVWVWLQNKTYVITQPLLVTDTIMVRGNGPDSSFIKKTTNTKATGDSKVDAIILVDGNTHSKGSANKYSYYHAFTNFSVVGKVTSYNAEKAEADYQYGIYSLNGIIKSHISHLGTDKVDVGISSVKFWNSTLTECRRLYAFMIGVDFGSATHGSIITGNNTMNTRKYGFKMGGANYTEFSGNLAEWLYGGTAFYFSACHGQFDNNGYELGGGDDNGPERGFHFQNCNAVLSGATFFSKSNCTALYVNGSSVKVLDSTFANGTAGSTTKNYQLCYVNKSKLIIDNCKANKTFEVAASLTDNSIVVVNGRIYDLWYTTSQFSEGLESQHEMDAAWNLPRYGGNPGVQKLRLGMTGYTKSYDSDPQYKRAMPKGSVAVNDSAWVNGVAGYITNGSYYRTYTSVAKVATHDRSGSGGSGYITFAGGNYFFDTYGTRMYPGLKLKGTVSGNTVTLGTARPEGGFYTTASSGTLSNETVVTNPESADNRIKNDDYIPIPAMLSGLTWQRPSAPEIGTCFFDLTVGKPVWYDGSKWVDSSGAQA